MPSIRSIIQEIAKSWRKDKDIREEHEVQKLREHAEAGNAWLDVVDEIETDKPTCTAEGTVRLSRREAEVLIDGQWYGIPNKLWAWKPFQIIDRGCTQCGFRSGCQHEPCREDTYTLWTHELLDIHIVSDIRSLRGALTTSRRLSERRDSAIQAVQLPPELFERIYAFNNCETARACRLVCRYWEKRCRSVAFMEVRLESARKVLDLACRFRHNPAWQHIPQLVERVIPPTYHRWTESPWMHLLDPRWQLSRLTIWGPFPGQQTLRSIHFALPRTLPRSFSRGITHVDLYKLHFRRFEDTTCLALELPDLEELSLDHVTWESFPTELPRRRPRSNRCRLSNIKFEECSVAGVESPSFAFAAFVLLLAVYCPSCFIPSDIFALLQALLQIARRPSKLLIVEVQTLSGEGHVKRLAMRRSSDARFAPFLILQYHRQDSTSSSRFTAFIDRSHLQYGSGGWTQLNAPVNSLPRSWHLQLLFGFSSRANMLHFAADVVHKQLTSLSNSGEVRYTISQNESQRGVLEKQSYYWYSATLKSRWLRGEGVRDPLDVYPDWG